MKKNYIAPVIEVCHMSPIEIVCVSLQDVKIIDDDYYEAVEEFDAL